MKKMYFAATLFVLGVLMVSDNRVAAEDAKETSETVIGTVTAVLDDNENVTSAKLVSLQAKTYVLVLDEKGKTMADALNGSKVMVTGTVQAEGDSFKLTVKEYSKVHSVTGTVSVKKDEADNPISATLDSDGGSYSITMDANGKALAKKLGGKKADVSGIVKSVKAADDEDEAALFLTVVEFKEAAKEVTAVEDEDVAE